MIGDLISGLVKETVLLPFNAGKGVVEAVEEIFDTIERG